MPWYDGRRAIPKKKIKEGMVNNVRHLLILRKNGNNTRSLDLIIRTSSWILSIFICQCGRLTSRWALGKDINTLLRRLR